MDNKVYYGPFLKALSGADPIQARRFAAAKALEIGWGGISKQTMSRQIGPLELFYSF